jgi:transposase
MLAALLDGRAEAAMMGALAKGRMRTKIPLLKQALTGLLHDYHRRLLTLQLAHIHFLSEQIDTLKAAITRGLMALGPIAPPLPAAEV